MHRYLDWVGGLDSDSLTALLRYVGEFGAICCWIHLENGEYPWPITNTENPQELRKHSAVVGIAMIYAGDMPAADVMTANRHRIFPVEYQTILSVDKRTSWAKELDRKSFESLIWNVGEFGIRALQGKKTYVIPKFPQHPEYEGYLRLSLYNIVRIFEASLKNNHRSPAK
jgi:hypothetical protein